MGGLTEAGAQLRIRVFGILFVLGGFLLIVSRAIHLQVVQAPALQKRADQQRQQVIRLAPQRGGSILIEMGGILSRKSGC